jgi:phosphoglycerol transferase MdoB-like AlkP superfamily enzyme
MLFITFLVLKLTKVIDWSWWWITAPLWIPSALFLVLALALVVLCAVFSKSSTRPGRFF